MKKQTAYCVCLVGVLLGAAGAVYAADPPSSPEQKVLDQFLGTWQTIYKIPKAEWNPEEKTRTAELVFSRVLGGQFVQERSEHSDKQSGEVMYTYDVQRKSYRTWWFSSTGQTAEAVGKWDADSKTLACTGVASAGQAFTTKSRHHFVDDDTFEWDVVVSDGQGKVLFRIEGRATRTKDSKK